MRSVAVHLHGLVGVRPLPP